MITHPSEIESESDQIQGRIHPGGPAGHLKEKVEFNRSPEGYRFNRNMVLAALTALVVAGVVALLVK
jgi:hypothetical protein